MKPSLYGLKNSNRDFSDKDSWGKNQFNSSFPTALLCYMYSKEIKPVYITLKSNLNIKHEELGAEELFNINLSSNDVFFSFETAHTKYSKYYIGTFPSNDLTILNKTNGNIVSSFEIKLTALPDNETCTLSENEFGTELVIRPNTIIYQVAMIIDCIKRESLLKIYDQKYDSLSESDWENEKKILNFVNQMILDFNELIKNNVKKQRPFIIQPIWKTNGKSSTLSDNCLDVFIWSTFSISKLFVPNKNIEIKSINKISRKIRTLIWITKMIIDYLKSEKFNGEDIINKLSYRTKNDKAFSANGKNTHPFMKSEILLNPRIHKNEIKNIILGGGENLLSPERRFDAIIFNSPNLFEKGDE